jgi:hypothetical protein
MKNFKQISKIACLVFSMLFIHSYVSAQTVTMNITGTSPNYSGTVYLCPGVTYTVQFSNSNLGGSCNVAGDGTGETWLVDNTCSKNYGQNEVILCLNAGTTSSAYVVAKNTGNDCFSFTANFVAIQTTISGLSTVCVSTTHTYTCTTNSPSVTSYTWSPIPSFFSGSSTSSTIGLTSGTTTGGPDALTVVVNGTGCSSGNTATENVTCINTKPAQPSGSLTYRQTGSTCYYDAYISAVSGATSYEWSLDNFSTILCTTTGPTTDPLTEFDYSTSYNISVKAGNDCGYGSPNTWNNKTTPGKPSGCHSSPVRPVKEIGISTNYKVYPNPANNQLTIENQSASTNLDATFAIYDMLGHKVISWVLPSADGIATEDITGLSTGLYLYTIASGNDIIQRGKVMIQR